MVGFGGRSREVGSLAKRKISLEEEKQIYNKRWDEFLEKSLKEGKVDASEGFSVIHNLNMMDLRLIEQDRRDLLG